MFDNLASSVTAPLFQQWEVSDQRQKLTYDLATAESQPNTGMAHVHVYNVHAHVLHMYMYDTHIDTCMYIYMCSANTF